MSLFQFQILPANAAALTSVSDTLSRLKASTSANHLIRFVTPTGAGDVGDTIEITFAAAFDTASIIEDDVDLAYDAACTYSTADDTELATATAASATEWGVAMASDVLTLTHPTDAAAGDIPTTKCVLVEIGEKDSVYTNFAAYNGDGVNLIKNGTVADNVVISFAGSFGDTGSLAVSIVSDDQILVTATVSPTFTFAITDGIANGCIANGLGTLSKTTVETCTVDIETSTNADNGYTTTIEGTTDAPLGEMVHSNGTDDIDNNTLDTTVDAGYEEFGVGTTDTGAGVDIVQETTCTDGGAGPVNGEDIDTNGDNAPASVANDPGPVNADSETLCFSASIDDGTNGDITIPGSYSATVTLVSTGTF